MNEKEILSISLASLVEIYPPQASDLYYDGCILGRRETLENESAMKLFRFPTRINALGVLFCSKGSISISSDLEHHVINPRSMFVCPPGSIVQIESEQDAAVHFIFCEEEFVNRVHLDQKQLLHLFMEVRTTPCLQLDDSEWSSINHTLEEIFTEGRSGREDLFSAEIMYSLFRALAYRISRVIDDRMKTRKETPSLPRHTAYFNAFIEELSHNYMQERSVGFYADRLHLTPEVSHHTAAHHHRTHRHPVDRRLCRARGQKPAEVLVDEHPGGRLLPSLPQSVVLRQVFQATYRYDPLGLPRQQVAPAAGRAHAPGG